jgi:hypothetical protein
MCNLTFPPYNVHVPPTVFLSNLPIVSFAQTQAIIWIVLSGQSQVSWPQSPWPSFISSINPTLDHIHSMSVCSGLVISNSLGRFVSVSNTTVKHSSPHLVLPSSPANNNNNNNHHHHHRQHHKTFDCWYLLFNHACQYARKRQAKKESATAVVCAKLDGYQLVTLSEHSLGPFLPFRTPYPFILIAASVDNAAEYPDTSRSPMSCVLGWISDSIVKQVPRVWC